jgi:hypothetical protein
MDSFLCPLPPNPSTFVCSVTIDRSLRRPEMVLVDSDRCRLGLSKQNSQVVAAGTHSPAAREKAYPLICPCYVRLMGSRVPDECLAPSSRAPITNHFRGIPVTSTTPNPPFRTHHQAKKEWMRLFFF